LLVPSLLPLGFDEMKRILSSTACHRAGDTTETMAGLNVGISTNLSHQLGGHS
jgi:hypothetical protein